MESNINRYLSPALRTKLHALELKPRGLVEGRWSGRYRSPFLGFSVEFADYRPYGEGDDAQRVDVDLYCRTGSLFVRQYQQETNFTVRLLLDISESMLYPLDSPEMWRDTKTKGYTKLFFAAQVAAALTYLVTERRDAVGAAFFDDGLVDTPPPLTAATSPAQLERLANALEKIQPRRDATTGLGKALLELQRQAGRRELIVILSDLIEPIKNWGSAMSQLRQAKHEVLVLHILHADELDFEFPEKAIRFLGREQNTDETTVHRIEDLRPEYLKKMEEEFLGPIERQCHGLEADYRRLRVPGRESETDVANMMLDLLGAREATAAGLR